MENDKSSQLDPDSHINGSGDKDSRIPPKNDDDV